MHLSRIVLAIILFISLCLSPTAQTFAATYTVSESALIWDGTDASRTVQPTAAYNYVYGDEGSVTYALPWNFNFYGGNYNTIIIDTNGYIRFSSDQNSRHSFNLATTGMGPVIAPWNNDLSSYYYGGAFVQHKTGPERVFIEWQTETYTEEGFARINDFEAVLYPDGTIRFDYKDFATQAGADFGSGISKGDGTNFITVTPLNGSVTSLAGQSFTFTNTAPPQLVIDQTATTVKTATITLTGTTTPGSTISVGADTAVSISPVTYTGLSSWSCTITGLVEGANKITLTANRVASTAPTTAEITITRDTTVPVVQISGPTGMLRTINPTINFSINEGTPTVKLNGSILAVQSGGTIGPLADGSYTMTVEALDAAGNLGTASTSFTVKTAPPVLTITQTSTKVYQSSLTLNGTVETGSSVSVTADSSANIGTINLNGGNWTCLLSALAPGLNRFTITATDQAGNTTVKTVDISYVNGIDLTITPDTVTTGAWSTGLAITRLPLPTGNVLVEQFVDANHNGVIDSGD